MSNTIAYFAYGSNMASSRLLARVPSARARGAARLDGHVLHFDMAGEDDSAKAGIEYTGRDTDGVHGVLFDIDPADKPALDRCEGLGFSYEQRDVTVWLAGDHSVAAITYYPLRVGTDQHPFHWYKTHVIHGAREFALPAAYVEGIADVVSMADPQPGRPERELAIYAHEAS